MKGKKHNFRKQCIGVAAVVQRVKNPALPQLWHRPQLWLIFHPLPRNFHMPQMRGEKKVHSVCIYSKGICAMKKNQTELEWKWSSQDWLHLFFYFLPLLFRATPVAYISSWARNQIRATPASLCNSHSNPRSLTLWEKPGMEPASSWIPVGFGFTPCWATTETGRVGFMNKGDN